MLYGGQLFNSYAAHPHIAITKGGITSTAAGAYQMLYRTWVSVQQDLGLPDFSPASQDRAAVELIRRRGALEDVVAGRFTEAIYKCRKEWASLPGAGYGQHERSLAVLEQVYQYAGGQTAA
jgi:lysozyme